MPYTLTPITEPTSRLVLRLRDSERKVLVEIAKESGFKSVQHWITSVVRIFMTGTPHFGEKELALLAESNFQLAAIGRNLNQIAKRLNSEPDLSAYRVDVIEHMNALLKKHTEFVSKIMQMNVERWRIERKHGR